jgi:hypothetical protein
VKSRGSSERIVGFDQGFLRREHEFLPHFSSATRRASESPLVVKLVMATPWEPLSAFPMVTPWEPLSSLDAPP